MSSRSRIDESTLVDSCPCSTVIQRVRTVEGRARIVRLRPDFGLFEAANVLSRECPSTLLISEAHIRFVRSSYLSLKSNADP